MSISFPYTPDTKLKAAPLMKVIGQVRFTPILKIAGDKLPEYQEIIRKTFPIFNSKIPVHLEDKNIRKLPLSGLPFEFVFETADDSANTSMGVDFIAITINQYESWTESQKKLEFILNAFKQVYGSTLTTRIGLRYTNALNLANTKSESIGDLASFLNPEFLIFENETWGTPVKKQNHVILRDEQKFLGIRTIIGSDPEPHIILDFDCYSEFDNPTKMTTNSILKLFGRFHKTIHNAFRWTIRTEKIKVFQPIK